MNRTFETYTIDNVNGFKQKMLNWSKQFNIFCLLDNPLPESGAPFDIILAAGCYQSTESISNPTLKDLNNFKNQHSDWIFGHLSYDLKNQIEKLTSALPDFIKFPDLFFFVPKILIIVKGRQVKIGSLDGNQNKIYDSVLNCTVAATHDPFPSINLKQRFSRQEYIETVTSILNHIKRGDCYEINFCQEFFAENISVDPVDIYLKLSELSPNPFAALYRVNDKYLICASPERFIKKVGAEIISQPIKGTAKRFLNDPEKDSDSKYKLLSSSKELAENIMVADLVRNDLSKICEKASVNANEIAKLHSFPQVFQLISTISGTLLTDDLEKILNATFPMGSMTGAPKKKVMELIEKYERTKRGVYSGALGYITPEGDFDFNVIIRSILYNKSESYISIQAGSAITAASDPDLEYEECLVKISATSQVLTCP